MFQHIYLFISRCSCLTRTINPEYSVCFLKEKPSLLVGGSQRHLASLRSAPGSSVLILSMSEWQLAHPQLTGEVSLWLAWIPSISPFPFWLSLVGVPVSQCWSSEAGWGPWQEGRTKSWMQPPLLPPGEGVLMTDRALPTVFAAR